MKLSKEEVNKVAKLANLPLSQEQEDLYSEQLSEILDYIDQLDKAKTEGVEPIYNVSGNIFVTRPDNLSTSLTQGEALANAPKKKDGYFVTKGVFDNG